MLTPDQISEIHRLHWVEKWSLRKIARHLRIGRRTITKYLEAPAQKPAHRDRASKLDPFKAAIAELLQQDPAANAPVIAQRLQPLGYDGGITIIKDYLRAVRKTPVRAGPTFVWNPRPANASMWTGATSALLVYNGATRKLYAFCLVECHSRKMFLEFTHSQSFETFARCHIHAFEFLAGTSREIWFDNLATAVAEHDGNLVRFNPRFLGFAREYNFIPRACHVRAAWEKGKVERAIGYVRQNFWPLRSFTNLADVNAQARQWLKEVANRRQHRETGQPPDERFPAGVAQAAACHGSGLPRRRRSAGSQRYSDSRSMAIATACRRAMSAASSPSKPMLHRSPSTISIMKSPAMPAHGSAEQTFGAERFQKELFAQMAAADRSAYATTPGCAARPGCAGLSRTACRYRSLAVPPGARTVRARSRIWAGSGRGGPRQSPRRTRFRRRLHRQHSSPAATTARSSAAAPSQRSGAERTRHRSALAGRIRRFHSSFPKGVP